MWSYIQPFLPKRLWLSYAIHTLSLTNSTSGWRQFYLSLKSKNTSGRHPNSGCILTFIHRTFLTASTSYDFLTVQQSTCQHSNHMTSSSFLETFKITRNIIK